MRLLGCAKPENEDMLYDYCLDNGHNIIHIFESCKTICNKSFIAMVEFITNYPHAYDGLLILHPSEIANDPVMCKMVMDILKDNKKNLLSIMNYNPVDMKNEVLKINDDVYKKYNEDAERVIKKSPNGFSEFPDVNINVAEGPCFMGCRFCYQQRNAPDDLNYLMPEHLFKKIVDDTPKEEETLFNLTCGGETLTFPVFFDYMKYALKRRPNIFFTFATNGVLLKGKIAEELSKIRNLSILVSLNAPSREEYLWFTQKDYYDRVCRNIKNFMKLKKRAGILKKRYPKLLLQLITLKRWEKDIFKAKSYWENIVDHVQMNPASFCEDDPDLSNIQETAHTKDISCQLLKQSGYVPLCIFLMKNLMVGRGGSMSLCCAEGLVPGASDYIQSLNLKTAVEDTISNIWNNSVYNKLRWTNIHGMPIMKACIGCTKGKMFDLETDIIVKAKLRRIYKTETRPDSKMKEISKKAGKRITAYYHRTFRLLSFNRMIL